MQQQASSARSAPSMGAKAGSASAGASQATAAGDASPAAGTPSCAQSSQQRAQHSVTPPPALQTTPASDASAGGAHGGRAPSPLAQISFAQFIDLLGMQGSFESIQLPDDLQPVLGLPSAEVRMLLLGVSRQSSHAHHRVSTLVHLH